MDQIYKKASKERLRFNSSRGVIEVEDLWALDLEELDSMHGELASQELDRSRGSLLPQKSDNDEGTEVQLRIAILKDVVKTRLEEREASRLAATKRVKRDQLLTLLYEAENDELKQKTPEELRAMIDEL